MKAEAEYQKLISNWPVLPANFDAVFEWRSNKDLYFLKMLTMGRWVGVIVQPWLVFELGKADTWYSGYDFYCDISDILQDELKTS